MQIKSMRSITPIIVLIATLLLSAAVSAREKFFVPTQAAAAHQSAADYLVRWLQ